MEAVVGFSLTMLVVLFGVAPASADCFWAGDRYSENRVVRQDDGFLHFCNNGQWDLQPSSQIEILEAWYGVAVHKCPVGLVSGRCNGESSCGLIAKAENLSIPECNTVLHQQLTVTHRCKTDAGVVIPGSTEAINIDQPNAGIVSCGGSD